MEHYDGPAFYRNNGRPATKTRVQTKVPAKTEKAPTKIATSNQKERLNGTLRAFSPRKVPRSLVAERVVKKRPDYDKLVRSLKKAPEDYLLFEGTVLLGTQAIDLTVSRQFDNTDTKLPKHPTVSSQLKTPTLASDSRSTSSSLATSESMSDTTSQAHSTISTSQLQSSVSDTRTQSTSPANSNSEEKSVSQSQVTSELSSQVDLTSEITTRPESPQMTGLKAALAHESSLTQSEPSVSAKLTSPKDGPKPYQFPALSLLPAPVIDDDPALDDWVKSQVQTLNETLKAFHVEATVSDWTIGPTVTQFELALGRGVKVNKITNLNDDLKLALAAKDIRIEAPIPGKSSVGIEIPNKTSRPVMLSEVLCSDKFQEASSPLTVALGVDLFGEPQITDLQKMPHGLIAGATGSGKSVFINSLLVSLLYKASPSEVKLVLIDPKAVEMAPYHDLPHLLAPVISDAKAAAAALKWLVNEMEERYQRLAAAGARNLEAYNEKAKAAGEYGLQLPYIVVVIDELADLMMAASSEVQDHIARITQKARAAGIHLLVATQRPSVDVLTGTIKNNIPTRIAFMVSSQVDSRTILDNAGAERLLGRGDMLYLGNGSGQPTRLQGTYIEDEVDAVTDFVRQQGKPKYAFDPDSLKKRAVESEKQDDLLPRVLDYIVNEETISTSKLQRVFSIGYNRAAAIIDDLEVKQYISPAHGAKPRKVFLTQEGLNKLRSV
jgi:DNA segregation ATPase FtsK/SpoIIIE and related proteins